MEGRVEQHDVGARIRLGRERIVAGHGDREAVRLRRRASGCHGGGRVVGGEDREIGPRRSERAGEDAGAAAEVDDGLGIRSDVPEERQQVARADVELGAGEGGTVGADPEAELGVELAQRVGAVTWFRTAGDDDARFLAAERGTHIGEVAAVDLVHRNRHVLEAAAADDDDIGRGPAGDRRRDLVEGGKAARQLHEHDARAREQRLVERMIRVHPLESRGRRVVGERELSGEWILVHAHRGRAVQGDRAEGEGSVVVADDDDLARSRDREVSRGLVEDQAVARVDRE